LRADRLISLLMLLQARGQMTAQDLAERLEVSERTIYRDLDALSAAGIPVYAERGPGGGCALLDSYRTNLTGLTEDELRSLFMLSVPGPLVDLGMSKALEAAQLKLSAAISAARRTDVDYVRQRIHLDSAAWFHPPEDVPYLEPLQEAVWRNRRIRMTYRRADGQWIKRLVDPYGLVAKAHIWYLVGATTGSMQIYRVSRLQEVVLTESTFERPANFDLAKSWAEWAARFEANRTQYSAKIRIASNRLAILPRIVGDQAQTLIDQAGPPDEAGWVTLTLPFQSFEEARMYILGFGDAVEVLAPPELHRSVVDFATRILTFYTLKN